MQTDSWVDIRCGNALEVLAEMPAESIDMCVTSPPYWSQRKYAGEQSVTWPDGSHEPYGLEKTVEAYIAHSLLFLSAIRRVLKPWGTCWWNIGDTRAGSWGSMSHDLDGKGKRQGYTTRPVSSYTDGNLKPLDMCLIPQRLVLAAQADGWYVRSMVAWVKNNPMPESVSSWRWEQHRIKVGAEWLLCPGCPKCSPNGGLVLRKGNWRPTDSYEYIIMLAKSDSYFCDQEAVREQLMATTLQRNSYSRIPQQGISADEYWATENTGIDFTDHEVTPNPVGRNLRDVWQFSTEGTKEKHFAAFPSELPRKCIMAGTSEAGVCSKCGLPVVRVVNHKNMEINRSGRAEDAGIRIMSSGTMTAEAETQTLGWRPSCSCGAPSEPATVLDLFCGTGTTLAVAKSLGRRSIGIDISEDYCRMSERKVEAVTVPMEFT